MAIGSSGPIELGGTINAELGGSATGKTSLSRCTGGAVATINTASPSYPDNTTPHAFSEWYDYDHAYSATTEFDMIMVEDFYGAQSTWDDTNRNNFTTTGFQDDALYDSDTFTSLSSYTIDNRPKWSMQNVSLYGSNEAKINGNGVSDGTWHASLRCWNRECDISFNPQPTYTMSIGQAIEIRCSIYQRSGSNKDGIFFLSRESSSPTSWGNRGDGVDIRFMDSSDSTYPRKIRVADRLSGTVTARAYSSSQFNQSQYYEAKFIIEYDSPYQTKVSVYMDGSLWISTSFPTGWNSYKGLIFINPRYANSNGYHRIKYITMRSIST
tara:strand:+ start:15002 stop:15976 length:975 start_codon:yes stop_codon:yes gene_type:complete